MRTIDRVPHDLEEALRSRASAIAKPVGGAVTRVDYGVDQDGDECLNVVVEYPGRPGVTDGRLTSEMDHALIDVALAHDEPRYLFIRHRYLGGGPVAELGSKKVVKPRRAR
jgi:hypothetical protein